MKILKRIVLTIITILIVGLLYIIFLFDWNMIKGFVEKEASNSTGRIVKLNGDIEVDFSWDLSPKVTVNNLTVSNMATGSAPEMITADRIAVKFNLLSLFGDRLEYPYIYMSNANLLLEKDKDGKANWAFGNSTGNDDEAKPPIIGQFLIYDSKLYFKDPVAGTDITLNANSSKDFRNNEKSGFDFINLKGEGLYNKSAFSIDYTGASVLKLEQRNEPYPLKTSLKIGHTQINVEGTVLDPNQMKGLNITLNIKGANAADLFPLTGIALPPSPPYSLTGKVDYADEVWRFDDFKGKLGDSDLSGNLSWDIRNERPLFEAKFVSQSLNFKDLSSFIGAPPQVKSTKNLTNEQKAKIAKAEVSPYIIPDAPLDISRLAAMDAKVEFTGKKVISPNLPLDDFYLNLSLVDRLLKIDPVKFGTADGDISAIMEINARAEPIQITSDFSFKRLSLGRLFENVPLGNKNFNNGYIGGTAKLKGAGKSLREMLGASDGTIGIGMEGGNLSNVLIELMGLDVAESLGFVIRGDKPVPIRCVIADFDVKKGLMQSKIIVMDTTDTNIKGEGTINLKNEKMDLKLLARPKDPSIFSLKSPIIIDGTLKNPGITIDAKELIARGSVAAAASVVLTPFVGALAFIEPGLGKDSDCAKYIAEMNRDNGNTRGESLVPKNKNSPVVLPASKQSRKEKPAQKEGKLKPGTAEKIIDKAPRLPGTFIPEN